QNGGAECAALFVIVRTPDLADGDWLGGQLKRWKLLWVTPLVNLLPQRLPQRQIEFTLGEQQVQLGDFRAVNLTFRRGQKLMCHIPFLSRVEPCRNRLVKP